MRAAIVANEKVVVVGGASGRHVDDGQGDEGFVVYGGRGIILQVTKGICEAVATIGLDLVEDILCAEDMCRPSQQGDEGIGSPRITPNTSSSSLCSNPVSKQRTPVATIWFNGGGSC